MTLLFVRVLGTALILAFVHAVVMLVQGRLRTRALNNDEEKRVSSVLPALAPYALRFSSRLPRGTLAGAFVPLPIVRAGTTIVLSPELLQMPDAVVRPVLAHEVGHMRPGAITTDFGPVLSATLVAVVPPVPVPVAALCGCFVALLVIRRTEFAADRHAAAMIGRGALSELYAISEAPVPRVRWKPAFLCYPSPAERIRRLSAGPEGPKPVSNL